MAYLVVDEKPSVGKELATFLGGPNIEKGSAAKKTIILSIVKPKEKIKIPKKEIILSIVRHR